MINERTKPDVEGVGIFALGADWRICDRAVRLQEFDERAWPAVRVGIEAKKISMLISVLILPE